MKEKLLMHCAEAKLYETEYLGKKALLKERIEKGYRNKELNERIIGRRVIRESNLISKAKRTGVRTPVLYKIEKGKGRIWMEFIKGRQLKGMLLEGKGKEYCKKVGERIGRLHKARIIHGDLTTSNILIHNSEVVFLDFGLGFFSGKEEDFAVDLLNLKKTFLATHPLLEREWRDIEREYCREYEVGGKVLRKMGEIEKRVRYK